MYSVCPVTSEKPGTVIESCAAAILLASRGASTDQVHRACFLPRGTVTPIVTPGKFRESKNPVGQIEAYSR